MQVEETAPSKTPVLPAHRASVPLLSVLVPVIAAVAVFLVVSQRSDGRLHLWVLDVGEGDATLLVRPRGHTVIVDGGPGATPLSEGIGRHIPFWQHNIDIVVLTAPQQENLMGLADLAGRYKIDQVVQGEFTATNALQKTWLDTLKEQGTPVQHLQRGDGIGFPDELDVRLKVLNPGSDDILKGDANTLQKNRSIVFQLEYGAVHILLAGDIESGAETNMLRLAGDQVGSQVLQVASHGSDKASTAEFIGAVKPQVSIISVAAGNTLGYPAQDTLNRLHDAGSQIYRTDQDGTLEVLAEKDRYWIESEK